VGRHCSSREGRKNRGHKQEAVGCSSREHVIGFLIDAGFPSPCDSSYTLDRIMLSGIVAAYLA